MGDERAVRVGTRWIDPHGEQCRVEKIVGQHAIVKWDGGGRGSWLIATIERDWTSEAAS